MSEQASALIEKAKATAAPLDTWEPDDCCGPRLAKSLFKGIPAGVAVWQCPKCSCWWKASGEGARHWKPETVVAIW